MEEENVQIWDGIDQEDEFEFDEEGVVEDADPYEPDDDDDDELPVEFGINFETGEMTGGKVTGLEAIKVWAWNALKIPRYRYEQFSWDYGSELEDLIGTAGVPMNYIESEAKRMVEECLTQNRFIEGIEDFDVMLFDGTLVLSFTIITTFGEVEENVAI